MGTKRKAPEVLCSRRVWGDITYINSSPLALCNPHYQQLYRALRFPLPCAACSGVARAQPMPGHSMGTSLVPRARPAFSGMQYGNAETTRGVWGMLPQKILGFLSFLGRFWGYFRPYRRLELEHFDNAFATNLRARSVRSL